MHAVVKSRDHDREFRMAAKFVRVAVQAKARKTGKLVGSEFARHEAVVRYVEQGGCIDAPCDPNSHRLEVSQLWLLRRSYEILDSLEIDEALRHNLLLMKCGAFKFRSVCGNDVETLRLQKTEDPKILLETAIGDTIGMEQWLSSPVHRAGGAWTPQSRDGFRILVGCLDMLCAIVATRSEMSQVAHRARVDPRSFVRAIGIVRRTLLHTAG